MPELPEVETVRRGLARRLVGRRFAAVTVRQRRLRRPLPPRFAERLVGRRVEAVGRRAKYLLVELDDGQVLLVHLGMSGRLFIDGATAPGAHDHVVFVLDDGSRLTYHDARRFGLMALVRRDRLAAHPLLAGLGPEPLAADFTAPVLAAALAGRRTPIKAALLDQRVVAGLGNIYVAEALHRAGISPRRLAGSVGGARAANLLAAIKDVLAEAIAAGGSSLRDYVQATGELGYFQANFRVYDREGRPCPACAAPVRRLVQSGRSTFYCGRCQR